MGEPGMAVNLHRCGNRARFGPCWRVQKALDDADITYEVVTGPWRARNRAAVSEGTGATALPRDRVRERQLGQLAGDRPLSTR